MPKCFCPFPPCLQPPRTPRNPRHLLDYQGNALPRTNPGSFGSLSVPGGGGRSVCRPRTLERVLASRATGVPKCSSSLCKCCVRLPSFEATSGYRTAAICGAEGGLPLTSGVRADCAERPFYPIHGHFQHFQGFPSISGTCSWTPSTLADGLADTCACRVARSKTSAQAKPWTLCFFSYCLQSVWW